MTKELNETVKLETPSLPPPAGMPPSPPFPARPKKTHQTALASTDPCVSTTNAAIEAVIDKIIESRNKAVSDDAANGVTGAYASAARDNLSYLTDARDKMQVLIAWLHDIGVLGVPPDPPPYVTNISASYNVHSTVRETVISLHYARHWALVSASYHKSADARNSYELTTQALDVIEPLGAQAGRCYMEPYGPFL